jgi:ornithine cyclodeaminase/alanine dehydrogenase-like protein (mu-crystallin family)
MPLVLSNDDVEALLPMSECVEALEQGYVELAEGRAVAATRTDALTPAVHRDQVYMLKTMSGVAPKSGVGAVRINSNILAWPMQDGSYRRTKVPATADGRYVGLVLLFSVETGEMLAILPDGAMQLLRVAATSGIAMKHLARPDAKVLAIFGTGNQAARHVLAADAVRDLDEIRCFSPSRRNREAFAAAISGRVAANVIAVDSPESAVDGADVLMCATNSLDPVIRAEWIRPGVHLSCIRWNEIPTRVIGSSDRAFIHSRISDPMHFKTRGLRFPDDEDRHGGRMTGDLDLEALPNLPDLLVAEAEGRRGDGDVTCFINNHGLGYQFAVLGALLLEKAKDENRGHALPSEWFTEEIVP